MISSEEIVERSFYMSLMRVALSNNLTLDPDNYYPMSKHNEQKFQNDRDNLKKFIYIFGVGNNQSRGQKEVPRITLELQGYYPGTFGTEKFMVDKPEDGGSPVLIESDFTVKDTTIDVHLVANTQADMRLLHSIMYTALPAMGYIKPFINDKEEYFKSRIGPSDNLFIEVGNYYDKPDNQHGLLEKVYSYTVSNGVITENITDELVPIIDISAIISNSSTEVKLNI